MSETSSAPSEQVVELASASSAQLPSTDPLCASAESILPVVDTSVVAEDMARALDASASDVRGVLRGIEHKYRAHRSSIELWETGKGWCFYTAPAHASAVERFLLDDSQPKPSHAAMGMLAVVAYRQPTTRAQASGARGANADGVTYTLVACGLIAGSGEDPATDAYLCVTTALLLEPLGIDSLDQLPDLVPLLSEVDLIDEPLDQVGSNGGVGLVVLSGAQQGSLHRPTHFTTRVSPYATSATAMR